jgi:SAM-dependent methyltransferase
MDYAERVEAQIAQYADTVEIHDLPPMFHIWSDRYIRPAMEEVFGSGRVVDVYRTACLAARRAAGPIAILSIGCGDGAVETELAQELIASGITDFCITGADLSPILLARFRDRVGQLGLGARFDIVETDLNSGSVGGPFDMVMAHHSLHHIVELEALFDLVHRTLKDDGVFSTCDMIGRNGHMRWPETKDVVDMFWPLLKPRQRYNAQLRRLDETFTDHDCSNEGFEGIRAQDILPLLLQRFHPAAFVGVGGFVDLMVDRGYGHGFDPEDADDRRLILCMAELNEIMLDAGTVKPTMMLAHFVKHPVPERAYRGRNAARAVRVEATPPPAPAAQPLLPRLRRRLGRWLRS